MQVNDFLSQLVAIVGRDNVLVNKPQTEHYRKGYRSGDGEALCVVFPTSLVMQWQVLKACVVTNKIIIMQAANTGLTEGSTPKGDDYDREIVIINTTKMDSLHLIKNGRQVISFPGATLHALEKKLRPIKRSPHSVIGSSCLGASIVGGVCNNSGGALVKRGPAYTELSLFAQVTASGELILVNHLGIETIGEKPEEILNNLEQGNWSEDDFIETEKMASDRQYSERIRDIDSAIPARFNADSRRLYEVSGCAGKLAVFAVRLDTYPVPENEQVFYIGTNDPDVLTNLRRSILKDFIHLPEVGEYMHRDVFDLATQYGKDTFVLINLLGTDKLPKMFALKGAVNAYLNRLPFLPKNLPDKFLQLASKLWPQHLPKRMLQWRDKYEHHLILKMSDEGISEAKEYLENHVVDNNSDFFICDEDEGKKALLHRFAAAGAPIRYETMHANEVEDVLALDIALPRNAMEWFEHLPDEIQKDIVAPLYYGHFLCYVFHQDYLLRKGADVKAVKKAMLSLLDKKCAKYPAEHNVGHLYEAEESLKGFYKKLDPTNTFNPGIGKQSKRKGCCG